METLHEKLIESARLERRDGKSVKEIASILGISVGSAHKYIRGISLSPEQKQALSERCITATKIRSAKDKQKRLDLQKENGWEIKTSKIDKDYNPKRTGDNSVIQIMACFSDDNRIILTPFGDNERYDLVIEENGKFIRVQCKTGRISLGKFDFSTSSTNWNTGKQADYKLQADIFAVYIRENKKVYIFKVENCPHRGY